MSSEQFVRALVEVVLESGVRSTEALLQGPPGRRPAAELVALSNWYRGLPEPDRAQVRAVARMAADGALFGVLAVLDGVRAIEPSGPKGELRLVHRDPRGVETIVSPPAGMLLHDLYRTMVSPGGARTNPG